MQPTNHTAFCFRRLLTSIALVLIAAPATYALQGGYASLTSVPQGGTIKFHISTRTPTYSIAIYREGAQRILMKQITGLKGTEYECPEPGYATGCGWPVAYTFTVPSDWTSGVYMAEFPVGSTGSEMRLINFVVREDDPGSTSAFFYTLATNTHSAYNNVGGKSLYSYNSSGEIPGRMVSYDRPYSSIGDGNYYKREHPFVEWVEKQGYVIEYGTSVDLHSDPNLLSNYTCFITVGHDEYWSRGMRDNLDAFVNAGGNAIILGGNTCWWQVRFSPDLRTIIGYKEKALTDDPYAKDGDPSNDYLITTNWYVAPVNYPENSTTGLGWRHGGFHDYGSSFPASQGFGGYKVYRTNHWIFEGTGLADGDMLGLAATIVGYEVDGTLMEARDSNGNIAWDAKGYYPLPGATPYVVRTEETKTPANFLVLGLAPATNGHGVMGYFEKPGAGRVFNSGTVDWVQGLASDSQVARITRNVMDELGGLNTGNRKPAAFIDSISPKVAEVGQSVSFTGKGTDTDGTIAAYRWRSSLDGLLSSQASFSSSGLSLGLHTIFFSVQDNDGAWSGEVESTVQIIPKGDQGAIILDNGQAGTSSVGTWLVSGGAGFYGSNSVYSKSAGATYTFQVNLPQPGLHEVHLWWTQYASRSTSVPVSITHATGTATVYVNQQANGGKWNLVGSWTFSDKATITIQSLGGASSVCADAVKLVYAGKPNLAPNAIIDSITPASVAPGDSVTFVGHGTDPDGTISAYRWRSGLDGELSNEAQFTTTGLSPGSHTIYFSVQDDLGVWSIEAQGTVQVISNGGNPVVVILDDSKPGTSSTGYWAASGAANPYGTASLYSRETGKTYSYQLTLPQAGQYEVWLWWTQYSSRLTNVPVTITHPGGAEVVVVNQQTNGGKWNLLGTWSFGTTAGVTITSLGGGSTCADAVKLSLVGGANAPPTAFIDSATAGPIVAGTAASFSGHGTDTDGTIAAYEWRSSRDGALSSQASFSTTSLSAGTHTIYFRVRDDKGAWSSEVQTTLEVLTNNAGQPIILDNGQPGTSSVGYWPVSGGANAYGGSSVYSKIADASYTYQVTLPQSGQYEVYLWWTEYSSRLTAVPVQITYSGGSEVVYVNQQTNGGKWNLLKSWSFGSTAKITILSLGGGSTCADAVKLVKVP